MKKSIEKKKIKIIVLVSLLVAWMGIFGLYYQKSKFSADISSNPSYFGFSGTGTVEVGNTVSINANISPNGNMIWAVEYEISYPTDRFELVGSPLMGAAWTEGPQPSVTPGLIYYSAFGKNGAVTSDSTLLTFNLKAKASGSATISYNYSGSVGGEDATTVFPTINSAKTITITQTSDSGDTGDTGDIGDPGDTGTGDTGTTGTTITNKNRNSNKSTTTTVNSNSATVTTAMVAKPTITLISYSPSVILDTVNKQAKGIIFAGKATPQSVIAITITSDPIKATSTANDLGNWSYTLDQFLPDGIHKIALIAEKDGQKSEESVSDFVFSSNTKDEIALGKVLPSQTFDTTEGFIPEPASLSKYSTSTKAMILGAIGAGIILIVVILMVILNVRRKKQKFRFDNLDKIAKAEEKAIVNKDLLTAKGKPPVNIANAESFSQTKNDLGGQLQMPQNVPPSTPPVPPQPVSAPEKAEIEIGTLDPGKSNEELTGNKTKDEKQGN